MEEMVKQPVIVEAEEQERCADGRDHEPFGRMQERDATGDEENGSAARGVERATQADEHARRSDREAGPKCEDEEDPKIECAAISVQR